MARRVYFAFHYRDVASFRANVVRNSWVTKPDRDEAGFFDASLWEEAKKKDDDAIKRMINNALEGTSVTVVLIGAETSGRKWVKYEIKKSHERGNGLLGIYIYTISRIKMAVPTKKGMIILAKLIKIKMAIVCIFGNFILHTIG